MKVLGIDPSLNSTGFSYRGETGTLTGVINPGQLRDAARLHYNRRRFLQILDKVEPDLVVYEGYAMGVAKGNVFNIGEMGGVYKVEMFERSIPYLVVPPSNLKLYALGYAGGKSKETKAAVRASASQRLGVQLPTSDEADAYFLMRMGIAWMDKRSRPRNRSHHENRALVKCELFQR